MSDCLDMLDDGEREMVAEESFPDWLDPMLATLVDEAFSDPGWVYERKLDGERCMVYVDDEGTRLFSRNRKDISSTYPELIRALDATATSPCVLDGEVVAFEGATTSFQRLQSRMQIQSAGEARESDVTVYLYLFDLLHLDGFGLRDLPLRSRKKVLRRALSFEDPLRFTAHRNEDGEQYYEDACASGWEGLIAKYAAATYKGTRSRDWLKFKCVGQQEFVVGGYTDPEGSRTGFGALLIGYNEDGDFVYAGKVGTGYDEQTLQRLGSTLEAMSVSATPFDAGDPPADAHWVEPGLVVEVGFTEWTDDGRLRHPRFLGVRRDKPPDEVVREVSS